MALERWQPSRRIIPWRPFRELEEVERRFDDIFGRPFVPAAWRRFPIREMAWAPAVEVFEKEDKFVVRADLPGVKEEDIDVSIEGDMLTIKGEKESESEVKEESYYCCERSYGSFYRSIALPATVDSKKIEASYEDGVLEVSLPKAAKSKSKKVTVSAKKKKDKANK